MGYLAQNFCDTPVDLNLLNQEIDRIAGIIVTSTDPLRVVLFGSASDGRFTINSDIDLLIVFKDESQFKTAQTKLASLKIRPHWPCDYLFVSEARYQNMKDIGGPIFMAHHHGKVLYDQATAL